MLGGEIRLSWGGEMRGKEQKALSVGGRPGVVGEIRSPEGVV